MKSLKNNLEIQIPINDIKEFLNGLINKKVKLTEINKTNKRIVMEYEGEIIGVSKNLFTIQFFNKKLKETRSYIYSEVSIGNVLIEKL